jgi:hypothetical protein
VALLAEARQIVAAHDEAVRRLALVEGPEFVIGTTGHAADHLLPSSAHTWSWTLTTARWPAAVSRTRSALRSPGTVVRSAAVPSLGRLDLEQATALRVTVRTAAEAAGRNPDEITCAANLYYSLQRLCCGGGPAVESAESACAWWPGGRSCLP